MSEGYGTYCGLLRLYDDFASEPDQDVPPFEYDGSHPGLAQLRRRYDLDRVAGEGDSLTRGRRLCDRPGDHGRAVHCPAHVHDGHRADLPRRL